MADKNAPSKMDSKGMNHERPLDSLMPELGRSRFLPPPTPMHQRVLEVTTDAGPEWVMACWSYPGSLPALNAAVKQLTEATLLAALCRPPSINEEQMQRVFTGVRLLSYPSLGRAEPALRPFGFVRQPYDPEAYKERVRVLGDEAKEMGWGIPPEPNEVWFSPIRTASGALGDRLNEIHKMTHERLGNDVWGATPGGPSMLFATYAKQVFGETIEPTLAGLDSMEMLITQRIAGAIRWIPPLLFQALCDFVGVVAQNELGVEVAWGACDPDGNGYVPPPVFRVGSGPDATYVPIGLHLLRWCVMPLQENEEVPPLSEWMRDQFGQPSH